MDGGVLAQAPVPLAVGVDVGADLAVRVEEGEAAEPEARVLAGADDAQAPDEALEADGLRVLDADEQRPLGYGRAAPFPTRLQLSHCGGAETPRLAPLG